MAIKKAEAECKVARIQTILKASDKSWQAAAWWLERRCPKDVKLTEREHKILVVTEWHEFSKDRAVFDEALRHIIALKGENKTDIGKCEERLNVMKYGEKKAPQKDIDVEKRKWVH